VQFCCTPAGLGLDELYGGDDGKKWLIGPSSASCNSRLADLDAVTTAGICCNRAWASQSFQRELAMSSISTAPLQLYPAPSPHGDLELTGLRGWVTQPPVPGFLVIVLGLSWLLLSIPVLAFHGLIPGANLPVEVLRWRRRC
jgi:hypothetical protein